RPPRARAPGRGAAPARSAPAAAARAHPGDGGERRRRRPAAVGIFRRGEAVTRKRVFIGSSSEALKHKLADGLSQVERIANLLSKGDEFEVVRWWEAFGAGDITVLKLLELARTVDGALLFFREDDKLESRGVMQLAPRDN